MFSNILNKVQVTSQGDSFKVEVMNDEIVYTDCYNDTLHWNDTPSNRELVVNMVTEIV